MLSLGGVIGKVTRYNDLILVGLLIFIIALMIIPLPTPVVDLLIGVNLAISVTMMMISLYIPGSLEFSVFPSLLLFTTLFRLSLNITTTRLILLHANAGEIIQTFGAFVVGGNLIVGAVIFLIITIVQFLVIAKGAERVSEVGARFTLDAMPGKQMSIDADMRAGNLTLDEARLRRELVQKESQLYGAMDGAMKFVKGDAIAGLIITALNIVGGVGIGVLQRGMTAGEAMTRYSVLTIGDGLVSQIPALLISITAGTIVTRVTNSDSDNLGGDIGRQFLARPKAIMIGGVIIFLFALIPGFPKPQLFGLAFLMLALGYGLKEVATTPQVAATERLEESLRPASDPGGKDKTGRGGKAAATVESFSLSVPVLVDLAPDIRARLNVEELNDEVIHLRRALYFDLGVPFPGINLRYLDSLQVGNYVILLDEVPVTRGWIREGSVLVREKAEHLNVLGLPYVEDKPFLSGLSSLWVETGRTIDLDRLGVAWLGPVEVISYHLSFVLKRHAANFLGIQETRHLLTQMEAKFPELVKETQRLLPLQKISDILQRLVQENVSIRNFRVVLEALVEWGAKEKDSLLLTEYVRGTLRRQISYQYASNNNQLPVYLLQPECEEQIRGAIRQTSSGSFLSLAPQATGKFIKNLRKEVGVIESLARHPVLLTSMDIRRYVRKMVEGELPDLMVLSYQELTPEITVQPLGKISM
ncbi:MAG: type III secretion system export apparatus subunit SctV [Planctomycetota bacterium]|jgi:type III secretion protein V|nr:type III secretion system export apparatus subunit SctV [Planctomycetota bacterium]